jgi:hypothetical protein
MDRRVLVKSLFGIAGAGALAVMLPPQAEALVGLPPNDPAPDSNVLPDLEELNAGPEGGEASEEGVQLAQYYYRRRRRRRRYRRYRWRNYCRRYWNGWRYRSRCRRRRVGFWIWL